MANVRVTVVDAANSVSKTADVPDDAPMNRLVPVLVTKLGVAPGNYDLLCKRLNKTLQDNETLAAAGIQANDELRLVPRLQAARGDLR